MSGFFGIAFDFTLFQLIILGISVGYFSANTHKVAPQPTSVVFNHFQALFYAIKPLINLIKSTIDLLEPLIHPIESIGRTLCQKVNLPLEFVEAWTYNLINDLSDGF